MSAELLKILLSLFLLFIAEDSTSRMLLIIVMFLMVGSAFIHLDHAFIGTSVIILYVGALAILFLFKIKLVASSDAAKSFASVSTNFLIFQLICLLQGAFKLHKFSQFTDFQHGRICLAHPEVYLYESSDLLQIGVQILGAQFPITVLLTFILWITLIGVLTITLV